MRHFVLHFDSSVTTLYAFTKVEEKHPIDDWLKRKQIAISAGSLREPSASTIESIKIGLTALNYQGESCQLLLPASWCFSASWQETQSAASKLNRRKCHEQRSYELEKYLPFDSEELICDFHPLNEGKPPHYDVLGVAIEKAPVLKLCQALARESITIDRIMPDALICFQAMRPSFEHDLSQQPHSWQWQRAATKDDVQSGIDLIYQVNENRLQWTHDLIPEKSDSLRPHLDPNSSEPAISTLIQSKHHQDISLPIKAFQLIEDICKEKRDPLISLSPAINDQETAADAPITKSYLGAFTWLYAALIMLCMCLCTSAYLRIEKAQSHIALTEQKARTIYQSLYPDTGFPSSIYGNLSTRKRRHKNWESKQADRYSDNALILLHQVMNSLPTSVKTQLLELRIEGDWIFLSGNAASHADADRLAISLRQVPNFEVAPPGTQKLRSENAVAFNIKINLVAAPTESSVKPLPPSTPMTNPVPEPAAAQPQAPQPEVEENP